MTHHQPRRRKKAQAPGESPQAEAMTVFWTLNVLGASAAFFACVILKVIAGAADLSGMVDQIMAVLVFIAGVTSVLAIVSYPLLVRLRIRQIPRSVVCYAVVICAAALGMSFWV